MHRVDVGEEERDRNAADSLGEEMLHEPLYLVGIKVATHLAFAIDPAVDLEAVEASGEWSRFLPLETVQIATVGVLDEDHVAKARVRDEGNARALALNQCVGRDGRTVNKELDLGGRNARLTFPIPFSARRLAIDPIIMLWL